MSLVFGQMQFIESCQNLRQRMLLSDFLSTPLPVIDSVIDAISLNPDFVEDILNNSGTAYNPIEGVRAVFGKLSKPKGDTNKRNGGLVLAPVLDSLEGVVGENAVVSFSPDVVYIAEQKGQRPRMEFADFLKGRKPSQRQILERFKGTKKLYDFLIQERDWMSSQLRETYRLIGDNQRFFFENLEPSRMSVFNQEELAKALEVHNSTTSRLVSGRYVTAKSLDGKEETYPINFVMPSQIHLFKYKTIRDINDVLEKEAKQRDAYSDQKISDMIPQVSRRAVTNYRSEAGIPSTSERRKLYLRNPLLSFRINVKPDLK